MIFAALFLLVAAWLTLRWRKAARRVEQRQREARVRRIWRGELGVIVFILLQCAVVVFCAPQDSDLAHLYIYKLVPGQNNPGFLKAVPDNPVPTRPDSSVTPGVVRILTTQQVCAIKWGADRRHVTEAMKRQVAANYGIDLKNVVERGAGPCCEIDHLVPRELGGADVVANLWPQPWADASTKDQEENLWHRDVCAGVATLAAAQMHFMHWGEK